MDRESVRPSSGIRVAICGAKGRMGSTTCRTVLADGELVLVAMVDPVFGEGRGADVQRSAEDNDAPSYRGLDEALAGTSIDVVVDFSTPAAVKANVMSCIEHDVAAVVGTTGLGGEDLAAIERRAAAKGVPVLVVPNFAMGAVMMMQFAHEAAAYFDACEIIELHHEKKVDAPSGTARLTQQRIGEAWETRGRSKDIPIHSVRLPGLVAHQEVIFGGHGETLTVRHDSLSRESFMPGVVLAVKRVRALQGLVVGLENII
jgi:4-hydroxy-tetrahydrodipicolinate reductase